MTPSPPPTAEVEQAAKPLEWTIGDDYHEAPSHVHNLGEDGLLYYRIRDLDEEGPPVEFAIDEGDAEIAPAWLDGKWPGPFATLDEAKQACQEIEDQYAANMARQHEETAAEMGEDADDADDAEEPDAIRRERDVLRKHDTEARNLAEDAAEKRRRWEASKKQTAKLKKDYEEAAEQLIQHAQDRPTFGPLFDGEGEQSGPSDEQPSATGHDPEGWRDVDLDELGIPHTLGKKLIEHDPPLSTLGAIADFTQEHRLTDIKGVGPTAAEQIEDATAAYWAKNPPQQAEDQQAPEWDGEPEERPIAQFDQEFAKVFDKATGDDYEPTVGNYLLHVAEFGEPDLLATLKTGQPEQAIEACHDTIRRYAKLNGIWPLADDEPACEVCGEPAAGMTNDDVHLCAQHGPAADDEPDTDEDDDDQPDAG